MDTVTGTSERRDAIEAGWDGKAHRINYYRYPTLPSVILGLLQRGSHAIDTVGTAAAESVYPALEMIRRAGPPDSLRRELERHIANYLGSPVWHLREMAARTLCSCLLRDGWLLAIEGILDEAFADRSDCSQNRVHGALLTLKSLIDRLSEVAPNKLRGKRSVHGRSAAD
jgi:hypothetical protein